MKRLFPLALLAAAAFAAPAFVMPALADDTITIGFTTSQTGPLNVDSLGLVRGYELWRDEVNAAGGIKAGGKSYKVNFVSYDDQSVGGRVQQLYTRLVNQTARNFYSARIRPASPRRRRSSASSMGRSWLAPVAPRRSRSSLATKICSW